MTEKIKSTYGKEKEEEEGKTKKKKTSTKRIQW